MEEKIQRALQALKDKGYTDSDLLDLLVPLLDPDDEPEFGEAYLYNPIGKFWIDSNDNPIFYYHVQGWGN